MQNFINAPHRGASPAVPGPATSAAPNAALLIDFDNVTMGIRSDLTRQLKELLNSDIIRGKVAVQRAYADWRRYAQYIVPLSEASVDLIFAPAYGSSKKNATDIRLAIDALELVFTRPEIGVYILLSGDSDFSSLVLKLKEYGKYVIGVGLRESASDLLVQNCDEYFSYSSLTGLTKAGEEDTIGAIDPWDLVERSVNRMAEENDVMRSDRLKQVMLDLDPNFDEGEIGYSKFNKFLAEAASRSKLALKKLGNGQYEVQPIARGEAPPKQEEKRRPRREEPRRKRPEPQPRADRPEPKREPRAERPEKELQPQPRAEQEPRREAPAPRPKPEPQPRERRAEDLKHGYELLTRAIRELIEKPGDAARDSDIKRKMLELESGWDESELGFTKFSRLLRQAHDAEVVDLRRTAEGYYEAQLPSGVGSSGPKREHRPTAQAPAPKPRAEEKPVAPAEEKPARRAEETPKPHAEEKPAARVEAKVEVKPEPKEEAKAAAEAKEKEEAKSAEAKEKEAAKAAEEKEEAKAAVEAKEKEGVAKKEVKAKEEEKKQDEARVRSYGRRGGRRGRGPEGPPPLLPGQAVWGTGGKAGAGPDAKAEPKLTAEEAATPKPEVEKGPAP
ncbi:MAG: NYN domain-containing protein, partial [Gemmatimonadota bacterium]